MSLVITAYCVLLNLNILLHVLILTTYHVVSVSHFYVNRFLSKVVAMWTIFQLLNLYTIGIYKSTILWIFRLVLELICLDMIKLLLL